MKKSKKGKDRAQIHTYWMGSWCKGGKTYSYWMTSWREGDSVRNVYLVSCAKMEQEVAIQRARKIMANAQGYLGIP
ncbi:MAG: hypothetical protein IPI63_07605 [Methanothrix sp.]|jgi:hypothetical protein|uniref:hypothetical protein n=1 Tax=Methanothrix sp. TaxID=90426 RepID=UPI001BD64319|nr:hypothetical protein [Methanothrix sp.]MBK7386586.1 hypothetical protein [Methanothrix sp.]HPW72568.1 hypothetical protein [Methanothrix sp.]